MLSIRKAQRSDIPLILDYIRELAEYEREPQAAVATPEDLERWIFGGEGFVHVEMAEWEGRPAGFALWFLNFSTWEGRPGLYLEDLFVRPEFRGKGLGKALLRHLAAIAVEKGCGRFVWQVLDWNAPSLAFYEAQGARVMREWLTCRLDGEALKAFASGAK